LNKEGGHYEYDEVSENRIVVLSMAAALPNAAEASAEEAAKELSLRNDWQAPF
jgi:hypothetical protein